MSRPRSETFSSWLQKENTGGGRGLGTRIISCPVCDQIAWRGGGGVICYCSSLFEEDDTSSSFIFLPAETFYVLMLFTVYPPFFTPAQTKSSGEHRSRPLTESWNTNAQLYGHTFSFCQHTHTHTHIRMYREQAPHVSPCFDLNLWLFLVLGNFHYNTGLFFSNYLAITQHSRHITGVLALSTF